MFGLKGLALARFLVVLGALIQVTSAGVYAAVLVRFRRNMGVKIVAALIALPVIVEVTFVQIRAYREILGFADPLQESNFLFLLILVECGISTVMIFRGAALSRKSTGGRIGR